MCLNSVLKTKTMLFNLVWYIYMYIFSRETEFGTKLNAFGCLLFSILLNERCQIFIDL